MPLDHYVTLGRSGLRVSPLCLGAMTFGEDLGWGSSVEESQQIIDRFVDLGGNFIDTANFYTASHSEKIIGDHIGRHPARRDRLTIATKFSGNLYQGDPNGGGSGRKALINACENSLRRLQTDYIDLYWLHMWDENTPIEETMAALDDLVRAGKVRYLGVSDTPAWKIAEANLTARFRGWSSFIGLQTSTRSSNAPSNRTWCPWPANSASGSRLGHRWQAVRSAASTRGATPARTMSAAVRWWRVSSTRRPPFRIRQLIPAHVAGHKGRARPLRHRLARRPEATVVRNIANLTSFDGFTAEQLRGVERDNALRLFPRFA